LKRSFLLLINTGTYFMTNQKIQQPKSGALAPDFSLPASDGSTVTLSKYPKPASLTFLRHLA
jgi:hypothetical protein